MLPLNEVLVSRYFAVSDKVNLKVLLFDELKKIKDGFYKERIELCRTLVITNPIEYKKLKQTLPAVTFAGTFTGAHSKEMLDLYSNIVILDIDNLQTPKIEELKQLLFKDEFVLSCWISPSGLGIKVLIRVDCHPNLHSFYYAKIVDYFTATYDVEIDTSGSDVSRLCFSSFDSNILYKNNAREFPKDDDDWLIALLSEGFNKRNIVTNKKQEQITLTYNLYEKRMLFKTEGRNKIHHKKTLQKIILFLKKSHQSITSNYTDWVRVSLAIANSFTYDVGKPLFLQMCQLDGIRHDEYKSANLIEYSYRKRKVDTINFSTIVFLAKAKGFTKF